MEVIQMQQILMIPGLCSDTAIWRRTIAALGSDFRCVVGDTLQDTTLPGMARRILDGAPDKFALAGVSMGGMVAMELMQLAPFRVTHLALDRYERTSRYCQAEDLPECSQHSRRNDERLSSIGET